MTNLLLLATGIAILAAMWRAFSLSRDPVHPMLFLGPMLLYVYVFRPWRMMQIADVESLLGGAEGLQFVLLVRALGVAAFCLGVTWTLAGDTSGPGVSLRMDVDEATRLQLRRLAVVLGVIGLLAFLYAVQSSGGLLRVYGRAKGGAATESGYLGEAPLLAFPAILLFYMSQSGQRWRASDVLLLIAFAFPHLIHGFLGTRRGPLFLVLATLALGWYLTTRRKRSLLTLFVVVLAIGGLVLLVYSQRRKLYLKTQETFSGEAFARVAMAENVTTADMFFYAGGSILTADMTGRHAWGGRMFVTLLVRPIPKQVWPTKYEDALAYAGAGSPDGRYYTAREWLDAVGWLPASGSARGFAEDFFVEFSWFGLVFCWLYGLLWAVFWSKARTEGGLSAILLVLLLALGIYVPTQSVSAVLHRFLFMGIIIWLLWRIVVGQRELQREELPSAETART